MGGTDPVNMSYPDYFRIIQRKKPMYSPMRISGFQSNLAERLNKECIEYTDDEILDVYEKIKEDIENNILVMKILSIPYLAHDSSICTITEDGKITFYKMEERFSRVKHDLSFDCILELLSQENHNYFDKDYYFITFFRRIYLFHRKDKRTKLKTFLMMNLVIESEMHHLYHAYCGFYNSGFENAICFLY
jgi:hypothetical protein